MRTRMRLFTPKTRHVAFLFNALLLVVLIEDLCDFSGIRKREILGTQPFEYPVLAYALYSLGTSLWGSPLGVSAFIGIVSIVFAVAVTALLTHEDADVATWQGAPSLLMVAVNIDSIVAFLILSAVTAWQRARTVPAGVWIGVGIALKVIPAFIILPLCAAAGWRRVIKLCATVVLTWAACNAPQILTDPDAWWFPYAFASQRLDTWGTFWKYAPLSPKGVNLASLGLVLVSQIIVSVAVWSRKVRPVAGVAVALLTFMLVNKVWMPQYILWVLPLIALLKIARLPVLALELTTLIYWAAFWFAVPESWFLVVMLLRSAAAVWVAVAIIRREQRIGTTVLVNGPPVKIAN